MDYKYDIGNIFAKIITGTVKADIVYEDDSVLAFHDISKKAAVHVLVIPKAQCINFDHFISISSITDVDIFFKSVSKVAKLLGLDKTGYRTIINTGQNAGQEVMHFHCHILGGEQLSGL